MLLGKRVDVSGAGHTHYCKPGDELTPFEKETLDWAVDHVQMTKSSEFPLEIEQRMVLLDEDFNIITFGTGDVLNGPRLFDLKTGEYHNYWLQVACYALMQMDRIEVDRATVDLLFIRHKNVHQIDVSREEATRRIMKVVKAVLDPDKKPRANAYCRWCRKVMTCSAVVHLVSGLEHERHEITDPEELSAALMTAKTVKEWAERVEAFAKEQALAGVEIPFFFLKSRAGAREIMDVRRAFELAQLPADTFLTLCNLPVGRLEDAIVTHESVKKSAAKKIVNTRLAEVIRRRTPTVHLAPTKNEDEPTER
jgi:CRISPR/Cas system-associated exonuclease Cas4 (RecB family)